MPRSAASIKAVNLWTSRFIPLLLAGIVIYVTWVFISLCINLLISPPSDFHAPRHGLAVGILVGYFVLFILMTIAYFRLLYVVIRNPGYVKRGDSETRRASDQEKSQRPGLEDFYKRDVFVCQGDGRPIWCSQCQIWKPDRTHHCREVDRCVRKMDHFCPWVGGVVSETSFKFFLQFTGYTALFCTYNLIFFAVMLHEYVQVYHTIHVHWVVTVALAALFGLFTVGMTGSSLQFALVNTTTIENLSRKTVVYQLAIHLANPPQERPPYPTITYSTAQSTSDPQASAGALKTFAILHSKPGDNPWDLDALRNFKSVMGERWLDWFLPLKYSPCTNHDRLDSQFMLGPAVERMKRDAGIVSAEEKPRRRKKRRRRKHSHASVEMSTNGRHSYASERASTRHERHGESA